MEKKYILIGLVVLVIVVFSCMGINAYKTSVDSNFFQGQVEAEIVLDSIYKVRDLPWEYNEYKLVAVFICDEQNVFVEKGDEVGLEIRDCQVYLAKNSYIEAFVNTWTSEISFEILPIPFTETPP